MQAMHQSATTIPTILVVDDEVGIVDELQELLEDEGLRALVATSGESALAALNENESIGILLTDLKMPGIGGMELTRHVAALKRTGRALGTVVMTGHGGLAEAIEAMNHGATDFITKPLDADNLLEALRRAGDAWRAQREMMDTHSRITAECSESSSIAFDLRRQNQALQSALRAQNQFLKSMGHELRTPLNHISGGVEAVTDLLASEPRAELGDWVAMIQGACEQLVDHVDAILRLVDVDAGAPTLRPRRFDLGAIIKQIARLYADRATHKSIQLNVAQLAECPMLADESKVLQAVGYSLDHLLQRAPRGSTIELAADLDRTQEAVQVVITDNGIEMDEYDISSSLNPLLPCRSGGDAQPAKPLFGLYLARVNAELHGGSLEVELRQGLGVQISLTFPLCPTALR